MTLSSSANLGSWDFTIGYDNSVLSLLSSTANSGQRAVSYASGPGQKSVTYTYTFKVIGSGSGSVYVNSSLVYAFDDNSQMSVSNRSTTIKGITQAQLEASYSKNNYLSNLSIEGYELTPAFNKDTLEYSIVLDSTIESINVIATKEDSKASITGGGVVNVAEGENQINVVVTAQNGNVRNYVINATVKEINPIYVEIDGNKYSIVKKTNILTIPTNYNATTSNIQGEDVPSFYNEVTNYTLVGLKDSLGNVGIYIYDATHETYTLYNEVNFNNVRLYYMYGKDIPVGYKETTIEINGVTVIAYKKNQQSDFALIYGMNVTTGKKGWYQYDGLENTLQRYDSTEIDALIVKNTKYLFVVVLLSAACLLIMVFLLILMAKIRKDSEKKEG